MIRDLGVVENPPIRLHPAVLDYLLGERGKLTGRGRDAANAGKRGHCLFDGSNVVLGQRACIGTRIGKCLVALVERLRERQSPFGRKAEAPVCLTLQAGQVVQQWRGLGRRFGFLRRRALLSCAGGRNRHSAFGLPEALWFTLGIFVLLESRIEPAPGVFPGLGSEAAVNLPVVAWLEGANFLLAFDQDRECWRLHPSHGGQIETTFLGIERGHRARAVDADQPVGLRA